MKKIFLLLAIATVVFVACNSAPRDDNANQPASTEQAPTTTDTTTVKPNTPN